MISEQRTVNRKQRAENRWKALGIRVQVLVLSVLLFACTDDVPPRILVDEGKQGDVSLEIFVEKQEIAVHESVILTAQLTYPIGRELKWIDFTEKHDDLSMKEQNESLARLESDDQQVKDVQFEFYLNNFGEIHLPAMKLKMQNGDEVKTKGFVIRVQESSASIDDVNGVREDLSRSMSLAWLPGAVSLLTLVYCLWVMNLKEEADEEGEVFALKEILASDLSDKEKAKALFDDLEKSGEFPEIKKDLEKALFAKSDEGFTKVFKALEAKL